MPSFSQKSKRGWWLIAPGRSQRRIYPSHPTMLLSQIAYWLLEEKEDSFIIPKHWGSKKVPQPVQIMMSSLGKEDTYYALEDEDGLHSHHLDGFTSHLKKVSDFLPEVTFFTSFIYESYMLDILLAKLPGLVLSGAASLSQQNYANGIRVLETQTFPVHSFDEILVDFPSSKKKNSLASANKLDNDGLGRIRIIQHYIPTSTSQNDIDSNRTITHK